jgi:hypothetical protein
MGTRWGASSPSGVNSLTDVLLSEAQQAPVVSRLMSTSSLSISRPPGHPPALPGARRHSTGRIQNLRQASPNGLRQDAVTYCLDALRRFQAMDQAEFMAVISEVAAVGQSGLQINEPGTRLRAPGCGRARGPAPGA